MDSSGSAPTRDGGSAKESPRTARGARTRAALVAAARTVFERDGYLDARLADITAEAKVAAGSFYTYFTSKEEVFAAVLESVQEEMVHPQVRRMIPSDAPLAVIEASNRAYLTAYRRNAKLMRLLDQVSAVDEGVRVLRRARGRASRSATPRASRTCRRAGSRTPRWTPSLPRPRCRPW